MAYELLSHINPLEFMVLDVSLDMILNVRKNNWSSSHRIGNRFNTRYSPDYHDTADTVVATSLPWVSE
ncbi:hypothetical protein TNCV_2628721 [Trichonephila clavipes]|uniref:Uncharacterized protein n=1 Tax=Trichonephila clavipes TaxID=2585209 RepID=A0A8X6VJP8_TRICX|nr:hypothetical protein TNCV_2628721 [Trichonephila clavipes]